MSNDEDHVFTASPFCGECGLLRADHGDDIYELVKSELPAVEEMLLGYGFSFAPGLGVADNLAMAIASRIAQAHVQPVAAGGPLKLTAENGAFIPEVREQILIQGRCEVPGHFRFQENGSSCLMCQREQRAALAMRRACIEKVRQLNQKQYGNTLYLNATQRFTVEEIIVALEAVEVKGESDDAE